MEMPLLFLAAAASSTFLAQGKYQHISDGVSGRGNFFHPFCILAMNASRLTLFVFLFALATTLTGCDAIFGIFKAGAYMGIIAVFLVVALLFFIVNKMRGRS